MTPEQFKATIDRNRAALNNLVARKMPILAGNIAKRHIEADFRAGGYTNNGRKPWKPTRRQQYGTGASAAYGPLLSGSNTLASSIQYVPQQASVTIFTRVPYAGIHNWGGTTHPTVTPKMRRYAWAMHYKESGGVKGADTMWKRMALTKKTKLTVKIPQRQFMGTEPAPELNKKITDKMELELLKILK